MITFAHMSDVHLAPLPPVHWTELLNKRITGYVNWQLRRHNSLSGHGLNTLVHHMREQAPDLTCITGDLVNLGLEAEADTAFNWLQTVGSPAEVCISPGNHDAYMPPSLGYNSARWGEYMQGETLDAAPFPFVRRYGDLAVISCSSAVPSPPTFALGRFDAAQAGRLARILAMLGEAGYFRVVLIHHPPNLEARHLRLGLYGAKRFRAVVAEHGAELVLHGHTHKSSIYAIPGPDGDVPVVGVAAAGAAQAEDGGEDPARYNLFKIERLGTAWSCTMREFGFQRLSPDIVLRLSLRIY
jgi:3',5'-cyclic AMP phosphodiesterase CpdA